MQLVELVHKATERASVAGEQARIWAAHMHSKSGSTGVLTTGSDIPNPILQGELNQAREELQKEKDLNASLLVAAKSLELENAVLRRQIVELQSGPTPISPSTRSLPRQQSPLRDQKEEDVPPFAEQAGPSATPFCSNIKRTYTPIQDYQWLITKEYFTDLEERERKMYLYER